jgi:hypothetical protein
MEANWVAVTIGTILASVDLANWTVVSPNSQFPVLGPIVQSVTYGNGRFIATGTWDFDQPASGGSVILYSDDAVHWEFASLSGLDAFGEIPASTFANGQFAAVQQHAILRSSDGVLWERFPDIPAQYALRGVAGAETGQFVTVGDRGEIMTSDDARTWITRGESPKEIHSVVFANGRFVAVGGSPYYIGGPVGSAAVLTSTNGYQWQSSLTNLTSQLSNVAYGRVAHGRKRWVVTGDDGQVFVSTDAIH